MLRPIHLLAAVAVLTAAPLAAQSPPAAQAPAAQAIAPTPAGPRLAPGFRSYQPALVQRDAAPVTAAAADRTIITISTLGLVLLAVLLILLLA